MPYPNALIQATPRNALLGRLSDALASTYSPERTQQAQLMAQFLSAPAISRTLDRLSYGEPLTTGAGGLGGTTRFNNDALESAMAIAPMVGPAAKVAGKGAMATGRFVAPKAGQLAEQYMVKTGGILPLDVYHGTPHTLPPTARNPLGEFDASKIGTGEGAQVYGYGIYTAENPAVAEKYQKQLGTQMQYKGQQFYDPIVGRKTATTGNTEIDDYLLSYLGDTGVVRKELLNAAKEMRASKNPEALKEYQTLMAEFRKIRSDVTAANTGSLYKADLPDKKIAKMLDFDKPLSQQPEILSALTPESMGLTLRELPDGGFMSYVGSNGKPIGMQMKGATPEKFRQNWINRLKEMGDLEGGAGRAIGYLGGTSSSGDLAPAVSEALRKAGIPGIKYLDEGSRNLANTYIVRHPQGGENVFSSRASAEAYVKKYPEDKLKLIEPKVTRNFVTFPGEEKSMTILERNGQKFDNSALMAKKFDVVKRDASEIFGAGAERFRYTDPASGGMIDVLKRPDNTASVLNLEVPEVFRGKGIGESLQSQVLQDFPAMMGQVSSKAAAKTAYRLGRRPPNQPDATLDDVFKLMDENSSVNLVSPKMQQTFNQAPKFDNSALMK